MHFVDKRGPGSAVFWLFRRHIVAAASAMGPA
jgi:hypothetical protein